MIICRHDSEMLHENVEKYYQHAFTVKAHFLNMVQTMGPLIFASFLRGPHSSVGRVGEWSGKEGETMWKESINSFVTFEIHIQIHIEGFTIF